MNKDPKRVALVALMVALLAVIGCGRRGPDVTPPPPPPPPEPVTEVMPPPTPPVVDETEREPELSIEELNRELQRKGLIGDVFFEYDKYNLRPDAREQLAKNAEFMLSGEGRDLTFTIEGHCDERGTNEYNIALGQRRSTSTVDYLVSLGVDRSRFKTISYGEERPFCTVSNEGCWQRNRRARFVVNGRRG